MATFAWILSALGTFWMVSSTVPPLIIDTDMNVDDMAALAFLLLHHSNILAITVSAVGFSAQWSGVDNALRLLQYYNRSEIPVAFQDGYFGQTQLNLQHPSGLPPQEWLQGTNVYFTEHVPLAASPHPPAWQSASQLIVEVLQASKDVVHFLELGPYTNLAAALHRDGTVTRTKIRRVYAEGGRLHVPEGVKALRGNRAFPWTTETKPQRASWNVFLDAIAAAQVYSAGFPTTLFADNACDVLQVHSSDFQPTSSCGHGMLGKIMSQWAKAHGVDWSSLRYWDQATVVLLMDLLLDKSPTICERWLQANLTVSLQNNNSYATFVQGHFGAATDACVVSSRERFLQTFYATNC